MKRTQSAHSYIIGINIFTLLIVASLTACANPIDGTYPTTTKDVISEHSELSNMTIVKDIPYRHGVAWDAGFNTLDIFYNQQSGTSLRPVIVFLHGGGWTEGDKSHVDAQARNVIEYFVDQGYVFVIPNFRLAKNPKSPDATLGDMADDVAKVLKWLSVNGRTYGAKTNDFILWGYSSGAHLATLITFDPTYLQRYQLSTKSIRGVIAMDMPHYDVSSSFERMRTEDVMPRDESARLASLRKLFGRTPSQLAKYSPASHVVSGETTSSFLLISVGWIDNQPQPFTREMTTRFNDLLLKHGIDSSHQHFENYAHVDLLPRYFDGPISSAVDDWLTGLNTGATATNAFTPKKRAALTRDRASGPTLQQRQSLASRLKSFDHDIDGKIHRDDIPKKGQKFFDRVDTDANGIVDEDELARLTSELPPGTRSQHQPPLRQRQKIVKRLESFDVNSDGEIEYKDVPYRGQQAFRHIDTDDNGIIDPIELKNFKNDR